MSYDVYVGKGESHNYTYNVSKLFYDHIPMVDARGGLSEIDGKTGKQAAVILSDAIERIDRTRHRVWNNGSVGDQEFRAMYDAPNGWGSTIGAIMFLTKIMIDCYQNPRAKVVVS